MLITLSRWPQRRGPNTTGSRTAPKPFITDSHWNLIKDLFENPDPSPEGGRPRIDARQCLEGILWVLKTGARWKDLPDRYPSSATCWRRHKQWTEAALIVKAWERLLKTLDRRQLLDWSQAIGDGTFSPAKKGGLEVGKTKKGKGTKIMLMTDGKGLPVSAFTTSAQDAEVNTIETLVDIQVAGHRPQRLLYDKAADADWLRDALQQRGIEQITPHRSNRQKPSRQDGRRLRRYLKRWKIERTISWLFNQRRLLVRHEVYAHLFEGFVHLTCMMLCLNRF